MESQRTASAIRRLKLRQLEVLLSVAQCGSMAKAAEQLAITQPVVSKSIADLEGTLGVRLLDRSSRGVEPTLYGHALLERSVALFNDLKMSVTELGFLSDSTTGELRIGTSSAVAAGLLGAIINRLARQYPGIVFEVMLGGDMVELPHRELRVRGIDLIIGRFPARIPDDMEAMKLYEEQPLIVAGAHNPLTRRRKVHPEKLLELPWCGPPVFDSFPWTLVTEAFRARGLDIPRRAVRTRSVLVQNGLLRYGPFLTVLPRTFMHFGGVDSALRQVPAALPIRTYPVGIITLKNRTLNPITRLFVDCAREVTKPFRTSGPSGSARTPSA